MARRVQLTWPQWVGLPLLMLLPLLALLELFGETRAEAEAVGGGLELRADYPTRLRMGQRSVLEIRVRNVSAGRLETVRVQLDPDYLRRFSHVTVRRRFRPRPDQIHSHEDTKSTKQVARLRSARAC